MLTHFFASTVSCQTVSLAFLISDFISDIRYNLAIANNMYMVTEGGSMEVLYPLINFVCRVVWIFVVFGFKF